MQVVSLQALLKGREAELSALSHERTALRTAGIDAKAAADLVRHTWHAVVAKVDSQLQDSYIMTAFRMGSF